MNLYYDNKDRKKVYKTTRLQDYKTTSFFSLEFGVETGNVSARAFELIAANALGIGAASFASVSGTGFGDEDKVTEPVEVPSPYF